MEIVAFAADVANHLKPVREADFGDFSQRRVRLFGSGRVDTGTDPATLRAGVQGRRFALVLGVTFKRWIYILFVRLNSGEFIMIDT